MAINPIFKEKGNRAPKNPNSGQLVKLTEVVESVDRLKKSVDKPLSVENFDEVKLHLKEELKVLATTIGKIVSSITIPSTFHIKGMPQYPDKINLSELIIRVEELGEFVKKVDEIYNFLKTVNFNPQVNVEAPKIPEIKIPKIRVPQPQVTVEPTPVNIPEMMIDFDDLLSALKPLQYLSDKASKPLTVRLSDGARFIKALGEMIGKQEKWVTAFSTAKGLDEDEFATKFKKHTRASNLVTGRKAVTAAGTAERIVATSTPCFRVDVGADLNNSNPVVVGDSGVVAAAGSMEGTILMPGNAPHVILIDDLYKLYVDSQTNNDAVVFTYYTY